MTILEKLYNRQQASAMCYFDTGEFIFKGEAQAYEKAYDLVKDELEDIEKLKKAIEILKSYNLKVSYIPNITRPHLSLNDYGDGVSLDIEEYELLKEVLG